MNFHLPYTYYKGVIFSDCGNVNNFQLLLQFLHRCYVNHFMEKQLHFMHLLSFPVAISFVYSILFLLFTIHQLLIYIHLAIFNSLLSIHQFIFILFPVIIATSVDFNL